MKEPYDKRLVEVFTDAVTHKEVADIIYAHSTNKLDVREEALEGLRLDHCKTILDIGCGFGFFTRALKGKTHPDAEILGIDRCDTNRLHYLESCQIAGLNGSFTDAGVGIMQSFPDNHYDLIICSYAMYFFPEIVPEIARILKPSGIFVTITHSVKHLTELVELIKEEFSMAGTHAPPHLPYEHLICNFCDTNGPDLLKPSFTGVKEKEYRSSLIFDYNDFEQFEKYFRFKKTFYIPDYFDEKNMIYGNIIKRIRNDFDEGLTLSITKNDAIYVCIHPQSS